MVADELRIHVNGVTNGSSQHLPLEEANTVIHSEGAESPVLVHPSSERTGPSNEYVLNVAFFSFIGFVLFQAVFAIVAHSQSMLADSEAMSVDAMTYLLNLIAERIKHTPYSAYELQLTPPVRHYRRELVRLYLEFLPPCISVITLMAVTIVVLQKSLQTLRHDYPADGAEADGDDDVSLPIMLIFSSGNLLLDILNVTCFARAHNAFGLQVVERETPSSMLPPDTDTDISNNDATPLGDDTPAHDETSTLLWHQGDRTEYSITTNPHLATLDRFKQQQLQKEVSERSVINLNMCSAWTHVCADTLRSVAVLVAAAIATLVPGMDSGVADAAAALAVSVIILASLIPLLHGLFEISCDIYKHWTRKP